MFLSVIGSNGHIAHPIRSINFSSFFVYTSSLSWWLTKRPIDLINNNVREGYSTSGQIEHKKKLKSINS